jgi:hypothetical protein
MKTKPTWLRILFILGILTFFIGTIDPFEGSILIALGTAILAFCSYLIKDTKRRWYLVNFIIIAIGVILLFYFSDRGGFGASTGLSYWWALCILPYPIGWLSTLVLLIKRRFKLT